MKKSTKILLSIPSVLSLILFFVIALPILWIHIFPSIYVSYFVIIFIQILMIIQIIFLIRYLWRIESIDKKIKSNWTGLMILFAQITALIFIWKKIDEFENKKG